MKLKNRYFLGSLLILLGFFIFISCLSFLFTAKKDLSRIMSGMISGYENWCGLLGAYLGYLLTFKGIGIGSISIGVIIVLVGLIFMKFKKELITEIISKLILLSLVFPLFLCIFLGVGEGVQVICGSIIISAYTFLQGLTGKVGAPIVVIILMISTLYLIPMKIFYKRLSERKRPKGDNQGNSNLSPNDSSELPLITDGKENNGEKADYVFPPLDLLVDKAAVSMVSKEELDWKKKQIRETLKQFKIELERIDAVVGPTVTLFEVVPAPGIKVSAIKNREDDIGLRLKALAVRIIAPLPGRGTIGIEVPNEKSSTVYLGSLLRSQEWLKANYQLPIIVGVSISNEVIVADLSKMPHLLIAGATGQGKSVGINSIIVSLLYKKYPSEIKFVMIDPKKVELSIYGKIANNYFVFFEGLDLNEPVITDIKHSATVLKALCYEMDRRTSLLKEAGVRDILAYNSKILSRQDGKILPYIIIVIDEFADLLMTAGKEIELPLARLAQMGRAVGIHLIIATQRPSTDVITGLIKANFPTRIAFRVPSSHDSRTILDGHGAERLIGRGDMLFLMNGNITRLQASFISTAEVEKVVDHIFQQPYDEPYVISCNVQGGEMPGISNFSNEEYDPLLWEAALLVVKHKTGSASLIQRHFNIGFPRAGRIVDQLEKIGIVGPSDGSGKPRKVLIPDELALQSFLKDKFPK